METRANHVLVGVVTLALLTALAAFLIWIVRFGEGETKEYDIFFKQSVGGLAAGTGVTFAGVPAGQVEQVELWNNDPEFVRVRISIAKNIPILQGTTATISSLSFTAPPNIQLDGAKKGAPPITEPGPGPGRVPIIPTKPGALGEILNSAPVLVQRLATLTDRLSQLLSDENQRSFQGILANSERLTDSLADQAPQLGLLIADSRRTVERAGQTADELTKLAASGRNFVDKNGQPIADDLTKTLRSAQNSLAALDQAVQSARPGIDNLSTKTLPQVDRLVSDLQQLSRSITAVTEQIEEGGAGSLLAAPPLPDYKPE